MKALNLGTANPLLLNGKKILLSREQDILADFKKWNRVELSIFSSCYQTSDDGWTTVNPKLRLVERKTKKNYRIQIILPRTGE
jgi:hypothetical protein